MSFLNFNNLGRKMSRAIALSLAACAVFVSCLFVVWQPVSAYKYTTVCDAWWETGGCCAYNVPSVKEEYRHCRTMYMAGSTYRVSSAWTEYRCNFSKFCFKFKFW